MPDTLKAPGLHVTKIGARLGVVVHGIDATKELTEMQRSFLQEALRLYKVIFLKRQYLDNDQHEKLSAVFGEPILHSTITEPHGPQYTFDGSSQYYTSTDTGHTDVTFVSAPPKVSILRALELPPFGGATVWGNTSAAYEDMPEPLKKLADYAWGIHSNESGWREHRFEEHVSMLSSSVETIKKCYITRHPVVRVHPKTQERHLLLGSYMIGLDGFLTREANILIEILQRYITRIDNTVSWYWEEGDVAIWDNCATQHYAPADFERHSRILRRITVKGDVPINIQGQHSQALVKPE